MNNNDTKKSALKQAIEEVKDMDKILTENIDSLETKTSVDQLQKVISESLKSKTKKTVLKEGEEEEEENAEEVPMDDIDNTDTDSEIEDIPDIDDSEVSDDSDDLGGEDTPADGGEEPVVPDMDMPEPDVVDLTGASDEEVLSVFKKMDSSDEIEVKTHSDGDIELKDGEEEYLIKVNDGGEEAPAVDVDMDSEVTTDEPIDIDVVDDTGEESPEVGDMPEVEPEIGGDEVTPKLGDAVGGDSPEGGDADIDNFEDELESINEDSDKREMSRVKEMGNKDKGHEQVSKKPKEVAPGDDATGEKPKETIVSNPKEVAPGSDATGEKTQEIATSVPKESAPGEETVGKLHESLKNTRSRLVMVLSENKSLRSENEALKKVANTDKEKLTEALKKVEDFEKLNSQYVKTAKTLKENLQEVTVYTDSLTKVVKLLSEQTLTKDEKINIIEKFDSVKTLEEGERVYNDIINESKLGRSENPTELVEKVINGTSQSGSKQINESTAFEKNSALNAYKKRFDEMIIRK